MEFYLVASSRPFTHGLISLYMCPYTATAMYMTLMIKKVSRPVQMVDVRYISSSFVMVIPKNSNHVSSLSVDQTSQIKSNISKHKSHLLRRQVLDRKQSKFKIDFTFFRAENVRGKRTTRPQ